MASNIDESFFFTLLGLDWTNNLKFVVVVYNFYEDDYSCLLQKQFEFSLILSVSPLSRYDVPGFMSVLLFYAYFIPKLCTFYMFIMFVWRSRILRIFFHWWISTVGPQMNTKYYVYLYYRLRLICASICESKFDEESRNIWDILILL